MNEIKKKKRRWSKWQIITFCIAGVFIIVLSGAAILNRVVENKVREQLEHVSPFAKIAFSSIHANLLVSSLSINDLSIQLKHDTVDQQNKHLFNFSRAEFTGLDFFKIMFHKKLSISRLRLGKGEIKLDEIILNKKDSVQYDSLPHMPFENVSINHFEIAESKVWLHSDKDDKLILKGNIDIDKININNLNKSSLSKSFHFVAIECNVTEVNYSIPGTYHILQIKKLAINSRKTMLRIDSLKIIPQYSQSEFNAKQNLETNHIETSISSIEILKPDISRLFYKELIAGKVLINESQTNIVINGNSKKSLLSQSIPAAYLNQIPLEIRIDTFKINHSAFVYKKFTNEKSQSGLKEEKKILDSMHFRNISINHFEIAETNVKLLANDRNQFRIERIILDDLKKQGNGNFHFNALECSLSKIDYSIPNSYYTVHLNQLLIDSKKALLQIDDLKINSKYSKYQLGEKLGYQADYLEATIPNIEISKLDVPGLIHKKLIADKLVISNCRMYAFRDRRLPRKLKEQPMLLGYLKQIPVEVHINTFKINNALAVSEEFPKVGTQTGILKIERINVLMSPLLNHPHKNDPDFSNTYVEGSIMDAGTIQASIHAPVTRNIYYIKGAIKNLNLPKLNPSSENLGKFHIESGILNNLDFHFTATEEKAYGEIVGEYHDLVIDRLKNKNGENKVAKIPTFFLKHLIIPKNKDKNMKVSKRTGKIDYKRDSTRLVTFYFLKALLSGIRASFDLGFLLPQ
jgi:hypothetical protein